MLRTCFSRALALLALTLAACGGANPSSDAQLLPSPNLRAQATQRALALDATALMDWAETEYHQYFPVRIGSGVYQIYTYRAYQAPGGTTYIGITAAGDVFVMGPGLTNGGPEMRVGNMADFGCRVGAQYCNSTVSGTAASGAPIAGVTVTLKDSTNHTVTTTTSLTGAYTLDTAGLTGPFLLQLTTGGKKLYGVTADLSPATVANLTPLTDLIVRSWYSVQGKLVDDAFANLAAAAPPTQQQTSIIADAVLSVMQLALNNAGAGIAKPLDLVSKPFSADHTGVDAVFDQTSISYGAGATVSIAGSGVQQTSTIGYDTTTGGLTATSTTAGGGNTSTSAISIVVPVQAAQTDALSEISAFMNRFAVLINQRGAALTTADLSSYLDPGLLNEGMNRDQFATTLVNNFSRGQTLAIQVQAIKSLDLAGGLAEVNFLATESLAGQSTTDKMTFFFHKLGGGWTIAGDRRIVIANVQAEARINQGAFTQASHPAVSVDVRPLQNTIGSVSAGSASGSITMTQGSTVIDDGGFKRDSFFGTTGPISGTLPAAGTVYTVTLNPLQGAPVSYDVPLNAFTTEGVALTSPTGSTLADAHLGGSLSVAWRLPTTYAVQQIHLGAIVFTGNQGDPSASSCYSPEAIVGVTATSGTLDVPATCDGLRVVSVNVNLTVKGVNGERSQTIYMMK